MRSEGKKKKKKGRAFKPLQRLFPKGKIIRWGKKTMLP